GAGPEPIGPTVTATLSGVSSTRRARGPRTRTVSVSRSGCRWSVLGNWTTTGQSVRSPIAWTFRLKVTRSGNTRTGPNPVVSTITCSSVGPLARVSSTGTVTTESIAETRSGGPGERTSPGGAA